VIDKYGRANVEAMAEANRVPMWEIEDWWGDGQVDDAMAKYNAGITAPRQGFISPSPEEVFADTLLSEVGERTVGLAVDVSDAVQEVGRGIKDGASTLGNVLAVSPAIILGAAVLIAGIYMLKG
jgi:hypothetical protein